MAYHAANSLQYLVPPSNSFLSALPFLVHRYELALERQRSRSCKLTRSRTYRQHQLSMVVICGDRASGALNSAFKKKAHGVSCAYFS